MSGGDWIVVSIIGVTALLAATGCLQWFFRLLMGSAAAVVLITALSLSQWSALQPARDAVNDGVVAPALAEEALRTRDALHRLSQPVPETGSAAETQEPPKIVIVTRTSPDSDQ